MFRGLDTAFSEIYETTAQESFVGQIKNGLVMLVTLTLGIVAMVAATNIVAFISFIGFIVPLLLIGGLVIAFFPIYYLFPEIDVELREVLPGALFGAIGWAILQVLFQVYVSLAGSDSNLIASIVLLVTWLYFSAVILLLGTVVNAVLIGRANEIVETEADPAT